MCFFCPYSFCSLLMFNSFRRQRKDGAAGGREGQDRTRHSKREREEEREMTTGCLSGNSLPFFFKLQTIPMKWDEYDGPCLKKSTSRQPRVYMYIYILCLLLRCLFMCTCMSMYLCQKNRHASPKQQITIET